MKEKNCKHFIIINILKIIINNEYFFFFKRHLDQVKGDSLRFLVLEIRDKSPKGEFLGYIEVNLNNIADLVQREEWFTLQKRKKKDKVTGEILLRTKIRPEVCYNLFFIIIIKISCICIFIDILFILENCRKSSCYSWRKFSNYTIFYLQFLLESTLC